VEKVEVMLVVSFLQQWMENDVRKQLSKGIRFRRVVDGSKKINTYFINSLFYDLII
jgi:hypothetical protein